MTANPQSEGLIARTRMLGERTVDGTRLRQRALAASALSLLLLGFLVAIGRGRLVVLAFLVVLAAAAMVGTVVAARRLRPDLPAFYRRAVPAAGSTAGAARATTFVAGRYILSGLDRVGRAGARFLREGAAAARRAAAGSPRRRTPRRSALDPVDRQPEARRLNAHGTSYRRSGDYGSAVESHRAALGIVREVGDRRSEALTLNSLALALAGLGEDEMALANFAASLAILRELDDGEREGQVVANLGFVHVRRGRRQEAAECLRAALEKLSPDSNEYRRIEAELRRAS